MLYFVTSVLIGRSLGNYQSELWNSCSRHWMWNSLVSEYMRGFFELVFFSFLKHAPSHSLAHRDKFKIFPSQLWSNRLFCGREFLELCFFNGSRSLNSLFWSYLVKAKYCVLAEGKVCNCLFSALIIWHPCYQEAGVSVFGTHVSPLFSGRHQETTVLA